MTKKIGCVILILVVCGFLGYQALLAGSTERPGLPVGPASNTAGHLIPAPKLTEADVLEMRQAEALKASLENDPERDRAVALQRRLETGETLSEQEKNFLFSYLEHHPDVASTCSRPDGNPLDNFGGPDASNYYYLDSVTPDTAIYSWIELRDSTGVTWISAWVSYDDGMATNYVPLSFTFPFYGGSYTQFKPSSNAQIEFGTTTNASSYTSCLSATTTWGPAFMPYMYDLHLQRGGDATGNNVVGWKDFGTYLVIEYDSIGYYSTTYAGSSLKFEVILFNDGRIKVQYNNIVLVSSPPMGTVGTVAGNTTANNFLQYRCNTNGNAVRPIANGLAIWFYQFLYADNFATTSIASPSGTYPANTAVTVTSRFTNFGTNTESSPIKYSFNGGAAVEEATAALAQNAFEDHTFATQFTTPGVGGTFVLTVYTDLGTDQVRGNDTLRTNVVVCAPMPMPFSEGFESTTGTALPPCWTTAEFGGDNDARLWAGISSYAHAPGTRSTYCTYSLSTVTPNDWLFTPSLSLTAGTGYVLDFWYREYLVSTGYYDSLRVDLTTATDNVSTVATIVPAFRATSATYQEGGATFTPPSTGDYYLAFVYTGTPNAGGVVVDDISLGESGSCTAPTVSVNDSSRVSSVPLTCTAIGGFGGPIVYQWYTGQTCDNANRIDGATNSTYTTFVSGDFACRAYRADSVNCAGCDWGHAEVLPPPPGENCGNALVATPPNANDSTIVSGSTATFVADNPDTCEYISNGPDIYYSLTLTSCRRITMKLEDTAGGSGDMHISVYESDRCGALAILCDDDKGNFDPIWWENPAQRGSYVFSSFLGGELPAGTYYLRVGRFSTGSGPYRLVIFDNGPCSCDLTCQGGDQIETAEDRYLANFPTTDPDGGCNSSPNVFGAIAIGQTVCGVGFNYLSHTDATHIDYFRDTDWYQFSVPTADTIHWTVTSEFRATVGLLSTTCPSPGFVVADTADACSTKTASAYLSPGDYLAFVAPTRFVGNPLPSTYRATLSGAAGCIPDSVEDLTVFRALGLSSDVILRWTADLSFPGTYTVYRNTFPDVFPGSWAVLASGIPPTTPQYVDTGVIGANPRRLYLVVGVCP
jgi:hypothetical protein